MIGYILWTAAVIGVIIFIAAVGYAGFLLLNRGGWHPARFRALLFIWSYIFVWTSIGFGAFVYVLSESEKPPTGTIEWRGGDGPDTQCEYVIKTDDTTVIVGKVPVNVEGADVFTRCSVEGPR